MRLLILTIALFLPACTTTPAQDERATAGDAKAQARLATELAGLVPGKPTNCLPATGGRAIPSTNYNGTVVYRISRNLKYRNDMGGVCRGLNRNVILVTQTPQARSCRGDIAQFIDRASRFQVGACAFGDFVPYTRP